MAPTATPVVDMATIEAAKENIVPLNSGRSASQLAALSSSTRSGLGVKLDLEHARFQAQIRAVDEYERNGAWPDGQDGLASEDVALLAEDPLDASHQYVRFIVANYPAGASAANKLVPVLEATTRKFLGYERYSNDPRYFRLWAHYAKNMEDPEDCYRFLFVKGVGEKLAALYEEYAKVLEAKNKCARRRLFLVTCLIQDIDLKHTGANKPTKSTRWVSIAARLRSTGSNAPTPTFKPACSSPLPSRLPLDLPKPPRHQQIRVPYSAVPCLVRLVPALQFPRGPALDRKGTVQPLPFSVTTLPHRLLQQKMRTRTPSGTITGPSRVGRGRTMPRKRNGRERRSQSRA